MRTVACHGHTANPRHPRKGSRVMTASPHWHVQRHNEDDDVYTSDTLVATLEYAGTELQYAADREYDMISANGDAGAFGEAYRCFKRTEQFANLAANTHNIHQQATLPLEQRAPLYQVDGIQHMDAIHKAGLNQINEITAHGPKDFRVWECADVPCEIAKAFEESD